MLAVSAGLASAPSVFDISSAENVEVGDLSGRILEIFGAAGQSVRRECDSDASPDRYLGDPVAYCELLNALGITPASLDEVIRQSAA